MKTESNFKAKICLKSNIKNHNHEQKWLEMPNDFLDFFSRINQDRTDVIAKKYTWSINLWQIFDYFTRFLYCCLNINYFRHFPWNNIFAISLFWNRQNFYRKSTFVSPLNDVIVTLKGGVQLLISVVPLYALSSWNNIVFSVIVKLGYNDHGYDEFGPKWQVTT